MSLRNFQLAHRPLVGGIAIFNRDVGRQGTLGLLGRDAQGALWMVSAAHVLVNDPQKQESIFQPVAGPGATPVARTSVAHIDLAHDVAAARLDAAVSGDLRIHCAPPLGSPIAATVGMNVLKVGATTGVTEGVVVTVGATLRIESRRGAPAGYTLTDPGDSGAAWLEASSGRVVGIHVAGNQTGLEFSTAVPIAALNGWGLQYC